MMLPPNAVKAARRDGRFIVLSLMVSSLGFKSAPDCADDKGRVAHS